MEVNAEDLRKDRKPKGEKAPTKRSRRAKQEPEPPNINPNTNGEETPPSNETPNNETSYSDVRNFYNLGAEEGNQIGNSNTPPTQPVEQPYPGGHTLIFMCNLSWGIVMWIYNKWTDEPYEEVAEITGVTYNAMLPVADAAYKEIFGGTSATMQFLMMYVSSMLYAQKMKPRKKKESVSEETEKK